MYFTYLSLTFDTIHKYIYITQPKYVLRVFIKGAFASNEYEYFWKSSFAF